MFQSAPPRRERLSPKAVCNVRSTCFNPRPREGSDWLRIIRSSEKMTFQSAPPRRERSGRQAIYPGPRRRFNPRPREGSDRASHGSADRQLCFNPRPREGSDLNGSARRWLRLWFQSAPPRRERLAAAGLLGSSTKGFQSAPPRRERFIDHCLYPLATSRFNPRPREGSDTAWTPFLTALRSFNPRPREGSDLTRACMELGV